MKRTFRRGRKGRGRFTSQRQGLWLRRWRANVTLNGVQGRFRTRKQRGSGKEEIRKIMFSLSTHEFLVRIGSLKPVATPNSTPRMANSETDFSKHIRLWRDLTPEDKNIMNERLLRSKHFSIDAFIAADYIDNPAIIANPIIFYAKEYLNLLALASEKTTEEILMIIATISKKTTEENDIINLAFGDEYLYGHRLSPWGERVKATYLALLH
jgi:hypothetical protein